MYQSYSGQKEFLYVPTKEGVNHVFQSKDLCYFGAVDEQNRLIAVEKVRKLELKNEYFVRPVSEPQQGDCYSLSGALVGAGYRKLGVGSLLIQKSLENLKSIDTAVGVFVGCDYRNIASFNTLSKQVGFIGVLDGRNGNPDENTLYTCFYLPLKTKSEKKPVNDYGFKITDTKEEAFDKIINTLSKLGRLNQYQIPYVNGYNTWYVLEKPVDTSLPGKTKICTHRKVICPGMSNRQNIHG